MRTDLAKLLQYMCISRHMNSVTLPIRQLFKVDKDVWSYLRVLRDKIRPITMSASLLQDETAAYEVSLGPRVIHGCNSVFISLSTPCGLCVPTPLMCSEQ